MMKFLPHLLLILFLFFSAAFSVGQKKGADCEKAWLIDHYFSEKTDVSNGFTQIHRSIILGKYDEAKKQINLLRNGSGSALVKAAAMTYEANIAYNESNYGKSIQLCDSAIKILQHKTSNRYVIRAMNFKAKALGAFNEYDKAKNILDTVILACKKHNDQFGLGAAYYYYGSFYSDFGDYPTCVSYVDKSVVIRQKIGDEIGLSACYAFLGLCYSHMDNYLLGIDYIQKSIKIRDRIGDKRGLANSYLTMYRVYYELGELDKAMDSEFKSLKICKELNDLQCVSGRYTNLGQIYQKKGMYQEALRYHFQALELSQRLKIKNRVAAVHENIARVYALTQRQQLAIAHLDSSLIIRKEIGDKEGIASAQLVLAEIQLQQDNNTLAIANARSSLEIAQRLKLGYLIKEAHHLLSRAYQLEKNDKLALYHLQSFVHLKDSLFGIDQSKELVKQELEFNFAQKEELQRQEQRKKEELARLESQRQANIILTGSSALVILSLLLGFSIWQYRLKNKSKKELELTNNELNLKNNELEDKNLIIETQNIEITDSIHYARQIQQAILPSKQDLNESFQEAFVIFSPKDLISGDFYWATSLEGKTIVATVDCTGHGVPGGFMSMLGISLLNELINEQRLDSPALILSKLRDKVISSLRQKGEEGEQKDGMDMTICVFSNTEMTFATANHVFYHVRKTQTESVVTEYKGDRHPVGIFGDELLPFHEFTISLEKGDRIYTFTDGYPDQFGGPKGKKLKYQQMKDLIATNQAVSLEAQGQLLSSFFQQWKGDLEQTDDVTVIGLEV